ncbi:hypothetical protein AB4144_50010, partial [Rhizobiaceae sp. 2RAB30]
HDVSLCNRGNDLHDLLGSLIGFSRQEKGEVVAGEPQGSAEADPVQASHASLSCLSGPGYPVVKATDVSDFPVARHSVPS